MQLALPFTLGSLVPAAPVNPLAPIYFVRHRAARRYLLRVEADGRARVTIPRGGSRRQADVFATRHAEWIAKQRSRLGGSAGGPEQRRSWRAVAEQVLPPRLRALGRDHGLEPARISIRDQRSRWGSCGREGHICLNWRLVLMPEWVRDYVLIHELMHLRRLDHSPQYWHLVAAACPEYQQARAWLRRNGPAFR